MARKGASRNKKRKFQENAFREEEIRSYLTQVKKFAISEDDKLRLRSLQESKFGRSRKRGTSDSAADQSAGQSGDDLDDDTGEGLDGNTSPEIKAEFPDEPLDKQGVEDDTPVDQDPRDSQDNATSNPPLPTPFNDLEGEGDESSIQGLPASHCGHLIEDLTNYSASSTPLLARTDSDQQLVLEDPEDGEDPEQRQVEYRSVTLERDFEVDLKRRTLPVCMMEQEIVDTVRNSDVVLITGDTGTGKSTQIPQFLFENGFCVGDRVIGVTQTRRVACVAISRQIALEMGSNELIGYQIRFDRTLNKKCKIKIMTDGILLNELKRDVLLTYSVVIIDEAHERRANSDILLGILAQVVRLRRQHYLANTEDIIPLK